MGKLLFSMALPAIISMLIEALYNIVDSMYVSYLGQEAIDAIGIGRPLIMIVISVGIGIGVGSNVFVARQLGFGDTKKANQVAKTAFVLAIVAWALFFALAWFLPEPFARLFTKNETTIKYHQEYVPYYMMTASKTPETICLWGVMTASLAKALNPLKTLWITTQITKLLVLQ